MTLFCNLFHPSRQPPQSLSPACPAPNLPLFESPNTLFQLPPRFIPRILHAQDIEVGKAVRKQRSQIGGEVFEGGIRAFEAVDETEKQCLLHSFITGGGNGAEAQG